MGTGKHILLADDESGFRFAASIALRRAGYRVTVARDGREALERLADAQAIGVPVDLIVTDQQMPGMTGTELIVALCDLGLDVPVAILTGCGEPPSSPVFGGGGFRGFIEKPLVPGDLVAFLGRFFTAPQEEMA
jgi:two-component system chemotaxis response regulator CheY